MKRNDKFEYKEEVKLPEKKRYKLIPNFKDYLNEDETINYEKVKKDFKEKEKPDDSVWVYLCCLYEDKRYEKIFNYLYYYNRKIMGDSSRKLEQEDKRFAHTTYNEYINRGRDVFKKLYYMMNVSKKNLWKKGVYFVKEDCPEVFWLEMWLLGLAEAVEEEDKGGDCKE